MPYVVETSIGCDRLFLAVLSQAYQIDQAPDADGNLKERLVLRLHPCIAPIKCAILPVVKANEALVTKSKEIFNQLRFAFQCQYDEKDSIGRRYRRQDELGTPYCITIDESTLENNQVTVRDRDTMKQEIVSVDQLKSYIDNRTNMQNLLEDLMG